MMIKNGIIFIWSGTNASIPTGWSRDTSLDDKYPKGSATSTDPNTTGGSTTHTHTSAEHTHTATAHTHTVSLSAGTGSSYNSGGASYSPRLSHTHADSTSGAVSNFSCQNVAVTYASCSSDPEYSTVIYITPTTYVRTLTTGVIALADATAPTGFYACDGNNSTPNLVGKFLKGASTEANAGTTGGSTTNVHTINHSHTSSHQHAAANSSQNTEADPRNGKNTGAQAALYHTHSITPNAATPTYNDNFSLTTTETVEPAYTKLMAIMASTTLKAPLGIIALWKGTLATIPSGWALCDGNNGTVDMRGRHLKITATVGEIGSTGGSNTHTHASQNHTHATQSHSHTCSNTTHTGVYDQNGSSGLQATAISSSYHTVSTNSVNGSLDTGSTSADSSNNEPEYRTVAFIKLRYILDPASFIFNMLT